MAVVMTAIGRKPRIGAYRIRKLANAFRVEQFAPVFSFFDRGHWGLPEELWNEVNPDFKNQEDAEHWIEDRISPKIIREYP